MSNSEDNDFYTYYYEVLKQYDFPSYYNPERSSGTSYPMHEIASLMNKKFPHQTKGNYGMTADAFDSMNIHAAHYKSAERFADKLVSKIKMLETGKKSPVLAKSKTKRCPRGTYKQNDGSCGPNKKK
jgi:hypothetical protein